LCSSQQCKKKRKNVALFQQYGGHDVSGEGVRGGQPESEREHDKQDFKGRTGPLYTLFSSWSRCRDEAGCRNSHPTPCRGKLSPRTEEQAAEVKKNYPFKNIAKK
jgi:hypothetical protein